MAPTLAPGGSVFASHPTAARLHRLDGFDGVPDKHVTTARGRRPHLAPDVVHHQWRAPAPRHTTTVSGIPCLRLAATVVALGESEPAARVQQALDDVLRRGTSLRWLEDTMASLDRRKSRATAVLRPVLAEYRGGAALPDSWFERLVQELLSAYPDLPPFERQVEVRDGDGRLIARLDLDHMDSVRRALVGMIDRRRRERAGYADADTGETTGTT